MILQELFKISEYPDLALNTNRPFADKVLALLKTYGFIFLFMLFIGPLTLLPDYFATHVLHYKSIREQSNVSFQHLITKLGYLTALIYICLIGPVLEETIFRLPLSFKKVHIALGISVGIFLFSSVLGISKTLNASVGLGYALLIRAVIVAFIYLLIVKLLPQQFSLSLSAKKNWIIISICLFGLMHISNYAPLHWAIIWLYPFFVLPQLLMGWALSYIRFKNGFIWGIALHCLINSVSMGLSYSQNKPGKIQHKEKPVLKKVDSAIKTPISPLSAPHS